MGKQTVKHVLGHILVKQNKLCVCKKQQLMVYTNAYARLSYSIICGPLYNAETIMIIKSFRYLGICAYNKVLQ